MKAEMTRVTRRAFVGGAGAAALCAVGDVAPDAAPVVRFGYVTDCHYAAHIVRPGDVRRYAEGLDKLRAFVREMNARGVDFVVEGGDFKDLGRTPAESLAYLDAMEGALAAFRGPRYHVLGNHDHDNLTKDEFLAHVANAGQERARGWYAFARGGVTFIVLDACYRPDGAPYARGNFDWKEAFLPPEQTAFLRATLAAAPGPCVPILHQQLDAEDETCIRNAAEVRRILEASGKVTCVVQGHWHEGSFREINGIGYYTQKASVVGSGLARNACSVISVYASGAVRVEGLRSAPVAATGRRAGWTGDAAWRPGHYQAHFIYTGRGESVFHLFPDGTSLLVDCGDSMRFHQTPAEVPLLPDLSRRAGEWVARYVARVNPKGRDVDYFHLSHYHEDHGGGARYHGARVDAPTGAYWLCGLADAARFLRFGRVVDRAWPTFDDPLDALKTSRDGTPGNVRAVYAHLAAGGTAVARFRLGARDQFRQLDAARARPGFEVFNLCANGRFVRRDGSVCDLYAARVKGGAAALNENGMSCGFVVTYGAFRLFSAGDFSDRVRLPGGAERQSEDLLAEAVGPVDVAKMNHHGHHAMFPALVRALRARVWTACVLDQQHVTDDTAGRLADRALYPGARTILPTYMPLRRPATPFGRAFLSDVPQVVRDAPCHLVLDVPPGGETYTLSCLSAADEAMRLKAVFGFFATRKEAAHGA